MYALNLSDEGRILSVTFAKYATEDSVIVDTLPEGDVSEYMYVNGEYIHDPLPKNEAEAAPTTEERLAALESAMLEMLGVNANG